MPKFFVDKTQITEDAILIIGENAHHISRSLRMAPGEKITVSDMQGYDYDCVLEAFTDNTVNAKILNKYLSKAEPEIKVHLYNKGFQQFYPWLLLNMTLGNLIYNLKVRAICCIGMKG